jgi:pilus assembly protein CpaC
LGDEIFFSFLNRLTYMDDREADLSDNWAWPGPQASFGGNLSSFVDALPSTASKVLAERYLICLSGQSAEFLAGARFPCPSPGFRHRGIE